MDYKREFPRFFEKTVSIILKRIEYSDPNKKNSNEKQQQSSSVVRVTRSMKTERDFFKWVRISNGFYKGDPGQVEFFDEANGIVHVKLLPRIDYVLLLSDFVSTAGKKNSKRRPPVQLFDVQAIRYEQMELYSLVCFKSYESNRILFIERMVEMLSLMRTFGFGIIAVSRQVVCYTNASHWMILKLMVLYLLQPK